MIDGFDQALASIASTFAPCLGHTGAGEGWRLLGRDEVVQAGDEIASGKTLEPGLLWSQVRFSIGQTPNIATQSTVNPMEYYFRRRIS